MHRKLAAALAASVSFVAVPALAADLPAISEPYYAPQAVVYDWSGAYIGLNGGYAWGDTDARGILLEGDPFSVGPVSAGLDVDGWFGGAQAGINMQHGMFVFGLEADIQYSGIEGSASVLGFPNPDIGTGDVTDVDIDLEWFGTARVRVGAAFDRVLVYATGGLAYGNVEASARVTDNGTYDESDSDSNTHFGYTIGAGVEYAVSDNWTVKGEYLYVDLGSENYDFNFPLGVSDVDVASKASLDMHLVRLGLNYKF